MKRFWWRWLFLLVALGARTGVARGNVLSFSSLLDEAEQRMKRREFSSALEAFQRAEAIRPGDAFTLQGVATALTEMGRYSEAATYFERAAKINNMPQFYMNAGMTYERMNDWSSAMSAYKACLDLSKQQFKPCHIKLAGIQNHLGDFMAVQWHLQMAIQLDPSDFQAYTYLGDVYNNLKQFSLAIDSYNKSIEHARSLKEHVSALISMGDSYSNLKRFHNASASYSQAMHLCQYAGVPPPVDLLVGKLFNQLQLCNWRDYEFNVASVMAATMQTIRAHAGPSPLSPYRGLFLPLPPALSRSIAQSWADRFVASRLVASSGPSHDSCKSSDAHCVLRLSYLSRRFEDYPGTQMMLRLFSTHNRSNLFVFAHAHGADDGSPYREHIRQHADAFVDVSARSDDAAAEVMAKEALDVLVSYDGLHDFNSIGVLLQRPAKIQMTWLGFAATTGLRAGQGIDYYIADSVIASPDLFGAHFSEYLVFMPRCYQPQDEMQAIFLDSAYESNASTSESPFVISHLWFSERAVVRKRLLELYSTGTTVLHNEVVKSFWYICFNRIEKITPDAFESWMHILNQAPHSILVVFSQSQEIDYQLQMNARALGVEGSTRIVFLNRMPKLDYLRTLAVADLFLDTSHYGAHTTGSDALFGSLPILTKPSLSVASRVASSLNKAISLPFLNVASAKEYVELAIRLYKNREVLLPRIRERILRELGNNIFNSQKFANQLERVYQSVYELYPTYKHVYFVE